MTKLELAFCANSRFFPGLACALASALRYLPQNTRASVHVIDAGLASAERAVLEAMVSRFGRHSLAWLAPPPAFEALDRCHGHVSMLYRLALPDLLDVPRVIYLDADLLVSGSLVEPWVEAKEAGKAVAAVQDWETADMKGDSPELIEHLGSRLSNRYFNAGFMVLDLEAMRRDDFTRRAYEMLSTHGRAARFADQTALNWIYADAWHGLESTWNMPAFAFDQDPDSTLPRVLHYTNSAPWLRRRFTPSQAVFERVAKDLALQLSQPEMGILRTCSSAVGNWLIAPSRILYHGSKSIIQRIRCRPSQSERSLSAARYWWFFFFLGPWRTVVYGARIRRIRRVPVMPDIV